MYNSGLKSDLSDSTKKLFDPTLLAIQYFTVEIKRDTGRWPENMTDYIQALNDTVNLVFLDFREINFKQWSDTLQIEYILNETQRVRDWNLEFVNPKLYPDSAHIKFDIEIKELRNRTPFETNEGRITFHENSDYFSVIHEFENKISYNKVTPIQP